MELGYCNGKTSVEAVLRKLKLMPETMNGWTDEECLNQLMCSLTEPVNQIVWEYDAETIMMRKDLV